MSNALHIVATCTDKKVLRAPGALQLRNYVRMPVEELAQTWLAAVSASRSMHELCRAGSLYSGVYWANVRRLVERAEAVGYRVQLSIASAGHGLLSADELVPGYSVTFSSGQADSVATVANGHVGVHDANRRWWAALRDGFKRNAGRDLVPESSGSVLVLGSPEYVNAMACDLVDARARLTNPDRFVVVTTRGACREPALSTSLVEHDARLTHRVGGAVFLLHARAASMVVEQSNGRPLSARTASVAMRDMLDQCPEFVWPEREPMSDDAVRAFVHQALMEDSTLRASPLLRRLREAGRACEQKRFKALFMEVERSRS